MEKRSERLSATGDISEAETAEGAKSDALATVKGGAVDEVAPELRERAREARRVACQAASSGRHQPAGVYSSRGLADGACLLGDAIHAGIVDTPKPSVPCAIAPAHVATS